MKKRQRVINKMFPFPSIPKTIPEGEEEKEEEEDEEEDMPLERRT